MAGLVGLAASSSYRGVAGTHGGPGGAVWALECWF